MVARKPDLEIGQRLGMLEVVNKLQVLTGKQRRTYSTEYLFKCDCGNTIQKKRWDIDYGKQQSCGCLKRNSDKWKSRRQPDNIQGQKFGSLIAIEMLPHVREWNSAIWKCRCDCGNIVYFNTKRLRRGLRLNCGHPDHVPGSHYPPTPKQLPDDCWDTIKINLWRIKSGTPDLNNQAVEDEKYKRLIRVAWIIHYRESQGEKLTELYKNRYIWKYIRFARVAVETRENYRKKHWRRYTRNDLENPIGIEMTPQYPTFRVEDEAEGLRPTISLSKSRKRRKYRIG